MQRLDGHRLQARDLLQTCASELCPALVRDDCTRWLVELRNEIPSVIFQALGEGGVLREAEVLEHGVTLVTQLDGRPFELDAGLHTFEVRVAGQPPKTLTVLVQQGEHDKLVTIDFRLPPAASPPPAPIAAPPALAPVRAQASRSAPAARAVPTVSYVLAGVAVIALGTGVGFGIDAADRESSARRGADACAPACTAARVDAIQRSALIADMGFGTALLATAGALLAYFAQPETTAAPVALTARGGVARLRVSAW